MTKSNPKSKPLAVKLDDDTKNRLYELGEIKNRSTHWLIKEAVARYLTEEEYNEQLKQETLSSWQEVQNGKVVCHQAVEDWLNSWGTDDEKGRPPCGS